MTTRKIRVRFAPSPTGPLHIGGLRTALYNYLFARKHGGDFLLRIEDTDSARFVPGAEEYIIEALNWCGITPNEGLTSDGQVLTDPTNPEGCYRQSARKAIYCKYAEQLIASGHAYYAFDTAEELDALRKAAEAKGETFIYNHSIRENLQTSLKMTEVELCERLKTNSHWVVRFKMPANREVCMHDLIRGDIKVNTATLDDKVLWKAVDELPTYHLANIVDDRLMNISHVIRGEEWLPSLPLHYLLYEAFGWSDTQPEFAHLSLLLKPDGKGKLSKRDGDRLGFPVFPLAWQDPVTGECSRGYREDGYFPEAMINLLALLGWNPGTEQELFSLDELVQHFSLDRVVKSGARFNPDKAKWFNQQYLREKDNEALACLYQTELEKRSIVYDEKYVAKVCGFIKERVNFVHEFWEQSAYFFEAPKTYDEKAMQKYWKAETSAIMQELYQLLDKVDDFSPEKTEAVVHQWIVDKAYGMGAVMNAFRLCVVGASKGPGMFEIITMLGKKETLQRIKAML
ncbi:MAG: glutamate--tRNA ligase [Bacteroidales bacterium]|nr:glutamate--tRNA ligase [Bacteroidales bacterium]MCL2133296.1 glutamate--tRNA ligase [Bacteroidales bacterium]